MMKIDLKARYQNMEDVVADLERYEASIKAAGHRSADEGRGRSRRRTTRFSPVHRRPEAVQAEAARARDGSASTVRDEGGGFQDRALRGGSVRDPGCPAQEPHELGISARLLVSDAETAAERFRESPVDAVIFDTDGQGAESIEAFLDMHETAHAEGQAASRGGLARAHGRVRSGKSFPQTTS